MRKLLLTLLPLFIISCSKGTEPEPKLTSYIYKLNQGETAYNIDEKGEEVCYLLDDIVGEIHSVVAPLICDCCRIKEHNHDGRN